jgi:Flp pilus assembly protein TadG
MSEREMIGDVDLIDPVAADPVAVGPGRAKKPGWSRIKNDESGLALVWMSLFLMVLLGFAALAVDIGHGYLVAQRAQNAADAAALGGTIYLPDDVTSAATDALAIASANGFSNGTNGVTVTAEQQTQPTQLKVTVKQDVPTWFAKAIGFDFMHVSRSAVADYDQPVAMGSPSNTFGNQPDCAGTCSSGSATPQFWANVAGKASPKSNGDRFQATQCGSAADNCPSGNANTDYNADGYVYAVNNTVAGAKLSIDAFDPSFVNVGDVCSPSDTQGASGPSNLSGLYTLTSDARYQSGATQYCTGDQYFSSGDAGGVANPPWTSFRVYEPDATPFTISDNIELTGCRADFPGFVGDLPTQWTAEIADPTQPQPLHNWFRKWVNICTINGASAGSYMVQVRTNLKADGTPAPDGGGHNRFAMRAGLNGSLSSNAVSIYGQGNMAIYANAPGASTSFFLARILPGSAGRHLTLTFYDTGDAGSPGTLQVLPPADSNVGASFGGCQYTPPPGNSTGPPFGTMIDTAPDCSVGGVSSAAGWNGQIVQWSVPIPVGYTCDFAVQTGCWLSLNFTFPGGTSVSDTTTWSATLDGNPVRLVQ